MNTKKPNRLMLLTGASGFIGTVFLNYCLTQGWRVRLLTRQVGRWKNINGIEVIEGDLVNERDWSNIVQGVDVVVNAAAEIRNESIMFEVNVNGPLRLLKASINAGIRRWIQVSSVGAYGAITQGYVNEYWPDKPNGVYEESKARFDAEIKKIGEAKCIEYCIVRPSNVYGPNMRNRSIYQLVNAIERGYFMFVGSPSASVNYVHVNDVVQALYLCLNHFGAANKTFIVSSCSTVGEMVKFLATELKVPRPRGQINVHFAKLIAVAMRWCPGWPLTLGRVQALSSSVEYSTEKISAELGWRAEIPIHLGMREMVSEVNVVRFLKNKID